MMRRGAIGIFPKLLLCGCVGFREMGKWGGCQSTGIGSEFGDGGISIMVEEWDEAERYTRYNSLGGSALVESETNAIFLLLKIRVSLSGDQPLSYPGYFPNIPRSSEIQIRYRGEPVNLMHTGGAVDYFRARGEKRRGYLYSINQDPSEVYPPANIEGWVGGLLSKNYDIEEVRLRVILHNGVACSWRFGNSPPARFEKGTVEIVSG